MTIHPHFFETSRKQLFVFFFFFSIISVMSAPANFSFGQSSTPSNPSSGFSFISTSPDVSPPVEHGTWSFPANPDLGTFSSISPPVEPKPKSVVKTDEEVDKLSIAEIRELAKALPKMELDHPGLTQHPGGGFSFSPKMLADFKVRTDFMNKYGKRLAKASEEERTAREKHIQDTTVGYWRQHETDDASPFPWPKENELTEEELIALQPFLVKISDIESAVRLSDVMDAACAVKRPDWQLQSFFGWSICRICGRENGSSEFRVNGMSWPIGYTHYIKQHRVRPPQRFVDHIMQIKLHS